jgi:hypothetical protein
VGSLPRLMLVHTGAGAAGPAEQIARGISGNGMRSGDCPLTMRIEVQLSGFGMPSVRLDLSHSGLGAWLVGFREFSTSLVSSALRAPEPQRPLYLCYLLR